MTQTRESILIQIRRALAVPAPPPGGAGPRATGVSPTPAADAARWLPATGHSWEENLALFQKNAVELKADFFVVKGMADLCARLAYLREAGGWKKIASHHGQLTEAVCNSLALPLCLTDAPFPVADLESCDAALTECDALVAQTGSVLVTSRSAGGRTLSVLPPHHIVLARRDQLLGGLPEAFALLKAKYGADYPSMISFITGPSRTGDIERILVLGAHGPKKLTVFLLEGAPPLCGVS